MSLSCSQGCETIASLRLDQHLPNSSDVTACMVQGSQTDIRQLQIVTCQTEIRQLQSAGFRHLQIGWKSPLQPV